MKAHFHEHPKRQSLDRLRVEPFSTYIAGAMVTPLRPALRAVLLGLFDGAQYPLFHVEFTPFDQTVMEVGWVEDTDTRPYLEFDMMARLPFPACPTLVLPGQLIHEEVVVALTARWLASMPHAALQWQRIKRHPGDAIARLAGTDDDGRPSLRLLEDYPPLPALTEADAWPFARFILSEEHLRAETAGLFACWELALKKQAEHDIPVDSLLSAEHFHVWFHLIASASCIPKHPERASPDRIARVPGPSDAPQFRPTEPPVAHPPAILVEAPVMTMLFGAVVTAFWPRIFALAVGGDRDDDGWVPVLRVQIALDRVIVEEFGRFKRGGRIPTVEDCIPFTAMTPPMCPTLVAPAFLFLEEDDRMRLLANWIAPCADTGRTAAAIRAHPGDPGARVQAAIDTLAGPRKRSLAQRLLGTRREPAQVADPVLTDEQTLAFVRELSAPEHFWPEWRELAAVWDFANAFLRQHAEDGSPCIPTQDAMRLAEGLLFTCRTPPDPDRAS
ncbi:MAG: hypothetical protein AB7K86_24245 [Rhodospirillales bacterium]